MNVCRLINATNSALKKIIGKNKFKLITVSEQIYILMKFDEMVLYKMRRCLKQT